jgi:AAA family ATPase
MRPGRLDRILYVGPPDQEAREEILKIRTRTMSVEPDLDVQEIARIVSTVNFPPIIHSRNE